MIRKIIKIDEDKCNGCGDCIPECKEGALQIIEGKCRLVSELFCDGLGACIGHCPEGAIQIEEREAEPYDEIKVIKNMLNEPHSVLKAHLKHLKDHGANEYYDQAIEYLQSIGIENPVKEICGDIDNETIKCPGAMPLSRSIDNNQKKNGSQGKENESQLSQWPVHLHLVNPNAQYFKDRTLVILSVCSPVASANIHEKYIKGNSVVLACPKLDYTEPYAQKLSEIFKSSGTKNVIILRMEVPCCGGLSIITEKALSLSRRTDISVEEHIVSIDGKIKETKKFINI